MDNLKEVLLKFFKLDSIVDHISGYVESRVALVKMEIREEVASTMSRLLIIMIMFLTGILFVLFISVGLAEYLNEVLGGDFAGFMIVGGFYGLLLLVMIVFRKSLLKAFENKFVGLIRKRLNNMELLETQDPEKKKLLELSERHRKELQKEVQGISQRTERVLTNALIVGGVLALSYFAVRQFSKSSSKKKKHRKERQAEDNGGIAAETHEDVMAAATPSLMAEIGTKVINQATLILIDLAREKLMEYLQSRKKDDNS